MKASKRAHVHLKTTAFEVRLERANLTNTELAKRCGINRVYLSALKNPNQPEYRPSAKLRVRMLKELKCKFDDIFVIRRVSLDGRRRNSR